MTQIAIPTGLERRVEDYELITGNPPDVFKLDAPTQEGPVNFV